MTATPPEPRDAAPGLRVSRPERARSASEPVLLEVRDAASGAVVARAVVAALSPSDAPGHGAEAAATGLVLSAVEVAEAAPAGAAALLAYTVARQARIERTTVLMWREAPPAVAEILDGAPMGWGGWSGVWVDLVLDAAAAACAEAGKPLQPAWLVEEVVDHVYAFIDRIYRRGFFRAVEEGTLTRAQYLHTLSQTHQYVRYTTRILGACVSSADDTGLRTHFIRHLTGEINHEIIIERDLAHLGADPTRVRDRLPPNRATMQFLLGELALIGWFRDPVLLTAAPLAAEGMSAHLSPGWIDQLNGLIASWGVEQPEKASRFLSSHIDFDSGDDGHWEGSVAMLAQHLTDEVALGRFVAAFGACADALERCYDTAVTDMALWSAPRS